MAIAVTLDQRASRRMPDRVADTVRHLNSRLGPHLALPFVRTAGDEMQAVIATGEGLALIARECLEAGGWWIGVGLGEIEQPVGVTARDTRGPVFWHAREAVERAQQRKGGSSGPIAVVGDPHAVAENLEAALSAVAFIVRRRTRRQQAVVELARSKVGLRGVAEALDVTSSAVSQMLRAAGLEEQVGLERLVGRLAGEAV